MKYWELLFKSSYVKQFIVFKNFLITNFKHFINILYKCIHLILYKFYTYMRISKNCMHHTVILSNTKQCVPRYHFQPETPESQYFTGKTCIANRFFFHPFSGSMLATEQTWRVIFSQTNNGKTYEFAPFKLKHGKRGLI